MLFFIKCAIKFSINAGLMFLMFTSIHEFKLLVDNIFELEKFLFFFKNPSELEKKQFFYEFENYTYYYRNDKIYFDVICQEIRSNIFNPCLSTKVCDLTGALLLFFDVLKKKHALNYNSIVLASQLITNFLFLSFEVKITTENNDIDLQWVWQYTVIESLKDFLVNFQLFYNNGQLFFNEKNLIYKRWFFFILKLLIKKQLLLEKSFFKKKKTLVFLSLKNFNLLYYNLKVFLIEPEIINFNGCFYFCGQHFLSLKKIFNENKFSNDYFKLKDFDFLKKIKSLAYHINWDFYNFIIKQLEKKFNCTEIELEQTIFMCYKNINETQQKNNNFNAFILYLQFLQIKKQFFNRVDSFYLSYFFDFRGRVYSYSCISPIGSKLFRYLYFYNYYSTNDLKNVNLDFISNDIIELIRNNKMIDFVGEENWQIVWAYWCLFEIGKIFKNELIIKHQGILCDKILIEFSLNKLKNKSNIIWDNLNDCIEFNYIIFLFNEIKQTKPRRLIVFKDATASGIQLLTLLLGVTNQETLKFCNLFSGKFWYDTYYFIIKLFLDKYPTTNVIVEKYFTRKYLKKVIMTYNYSIGVGKAKLYFFESVLDEDKNNTTLKTYFGLFFKFLKNLFEGGLFYANPSKVIINTFKRRLKETKKLEIKLPDESLIFLQYNYLKKIRLDRIIQHTRKTIVFFTLDDKINDYKTCIALRANLIHSLDATYVRFVIKYLDYSIITIHDSFGIDILNVSKLIFIANKSVNAVGFIDELSFLDKNTVVYNSNYILF